jgi:ABC-2 type transport system permease protein
MNKIILILKREYFTRVKKRSFLLTTILVPLVIIGFYAAILAIGMSDTSAKERIAVLDEANLLDSSSLKQNKGLEWVFFSKQTEKSLIEMYDTLGFDHFLYIPKQEDSLAEISSVLHSKAVASFSTLGEIEDNLSESNRLKKLRKMGLDPVAFNKAMSDVKLTKVTDSKDGAKDQVAGVAYGVSFICGLLIYMMMIIYGTQVMRGVSEEKTNRISEVVVSSVKPFQLMLGKILGIGAVGLTQFSIWILLMYGVKSALPLIIPELHSEVDVALQSGSFGLIATTLKGLASLPLGKIVFLFIFYFLGGYLTYASIFAALGSVVSEDQQEAQQMVFPVLMPIILGFVMLTKAINDPNSSLAVFGSIFPLTSPIVMMGRITYDVPIWQLGVSMLSLILCFLLFTWLAGKVYRTGILMYGKKISWKQLIKWGMGK